MPSEFTRTTCACADCVSCCKQQPGPLAPGDLEAIAEHLGKRRRDVAVKFWASPGALVQGADGKRWMIPTITPRMTQGRCVFLDPDDRCQIHPVAPFGCAYADTHMTEAEWGPRAQWLLPRDRGGRRLPIISQDVDRRHVMATKNRTVND